MMLANSNKVAFHIHVNSFCQQFKNILHLRLASCFVLHKILFPVLSLTFIIYSIPFVIILSAAFQ